MTHVETLSLILSVVGLIVSIIFATTILELHKRQIEIDKKQDTIDTLIKQLTESMISDCGCIYPMHSSGKKLEFNINGKEFVTWFKLKYSYPDDLTAVNAIKNLDEHKLIEEYIIEKDLLKAQENK